MYTAGRDPVAKLPGARCTRCGVGYSAHMRQLDVCVVHGLRGDCDARGVFHVFDLDSPHGYFQGEIVARMNRQVERTLWFLATGPSKGKNKTQNPRAVLLPKLAS